MAFSPIFSMDVSRERPIDLAKSQDMRSAINRTSIIISKSSPTYHISWMWQNGIFVAPRLTPNQTKLSDEIISLTILQPIGHPSRNTLHAYKIIRWFQKLVKHFPRNPTQLLRGDLV